MNILEKTLNEMPVTFSSNQFASRARQNGLSQQEINNGIGGLFLHQNAVQGLSRRMWHKQTTNVAIPNNSMPERIATAIELLKQNGYKVLKPITEYVEA